MIKLSETTERKFIESYLIDDYEVLTEDGWQDISAIHKTIPYKKWTIKTTNHKLSGADNHIVYFFDKYLQEIFIKDLKPGMHIATDTGLEEVLSVENNNISENMYDLEVNSESHTYYTNRYFIA